MYAVRILCLYIIVLLFWVGLSAGTSDESLRVVQASKVLSSIQGGGPAEYDDYRIEGELNLSNLVINGDSHFNDTFFQDGVNFGSTIFNGTAYFNGAKFNGYADFKGATFRRNAYFVGYSRHFKVNGIPISGYDSTTFSGIASFNGATFEGDTVFLNAWFKGDAYFRDATFSENAVFETASFTGTDFFNAKFGGNVNLKATFSQHASFWLATFSKYATFAGATFQKSSSFEKAEFKEDASFDVTEFNGTANFNGSTFIRDATFIEARFSDDADFASTEFDNDIEFDFVRFGKNTRFDKARFKGPAYFEGSSIGNLNLNKADYNRLYLHWDNIMSLDFDEGAYLALINNYNNLGWYNDVNECYYDYRNVVRKNWLSASAPNLITRVSNIFNYLIDSIEWLLYGYGVRPGLPIVWSIFLVLAFGSFFKHKNCLRKLITEKIIEKTIENSKKVAVNVITLEEQMASIDPFFFSLLTFTSGFASFFQPSVEYELEHHTRWAIFERLLGTFFIALLITAFSKTYLIR